MTVLYQVLVSDSGGARELLSRLADASRNGELASATEASPIAQGLEVTAAAGARVMVEVVQLAPRERVAARSFDEPDVALALTPQSADDPESVGLAWELLAALNLWAPSPVWISVEAYDERTIEQVGTPRMVDLGGCPGHVLTPTELASLFEMSG